MRKHLFTLAAVALLSPALAYGSTATTTTLTIDLSGNIVATFPDGSNRTYATQLGSSGFASMLRGTMGLKDSVDHLASDFYPNTNPQRFISANDVAAVSPVRSVAGLNGVISPADLATALALKSASYHLATDFYPASNPLGFLSTQAATALIASQAVVVAPVRSVAGATGDVTSAQIAYAACGIASAQGCGTGGGSGGGGTTPGTGSTAITATITVSPEQIAYAACGVSTAQGCAIAGSGGGGGGTAGVTSFGGLTGVVTVQQAQTALTLGSAAYQPSTAFVTPAQLASAVAAGGGGGGAVASVAGATGVVTAGQISTALGLGTAALQPSTAFYASSNPSGYQTAAQVTTAVNAAKAGPATSTVAGLVKPGTGLTVTSDGTLNATGGGGGGVAGVSSVDGRTGDVTAAQLATDLASSFYAAGNPAGYQTASQVSTAIAAPGYVTAAQAATAAPVQSVAGATGVVTTAQLRTALAYATVATSGAYADLTGKPVLAPVATAGTYASLTGTPTLAPVATAGTYASLTGTPTLAPVATAGTYASLTGQPTIPVAGTTAGTYAAGNDSRIVGAYPATNPANYITAAGAPVASVAGNTGPITAAQIAQAACGVSAPQGCAGTGGGVVTVSSPVTTVAVSGTAYALAWPASGGRQVYNITLTANCALTITGTAASGQESEIVVYVKQDATAGRVLTLPTVNGWAGGRVPTPNTSAGVVDRYVFRTADAAATTFGGY